MKPITYSLQFRGQATHVEGGLRKEASAPTCALLTNLTPDGVEGHYVWAPDDDEAFFVSTLAFTEGDSFEEKGRIVFSRGNTLRIRGRGQLGASPDPHLRQGTVVWEVTGGEGQFDGASGRITSNFFLSDTSDLTENQLGVIFTLGVGPGIPRKPTTPPLRDHRDTARRRGSTEEEQ
jgi:hypothetical protein